MKLFGNIQNSAIFTFQPEDHQKRYTKVWSQIPAEHLVRFEQGFFRF